MSAQCARSGNVVGAPPRRMTGRASAQAEGVRDSSLPALHADAAKIARLYELTDDMLAVISLHGAFQVLNPAWEQALGWSKQEMIGKPLRDFIHPDDAEEAIILTIGGAARSAHIVNFTTRYRHKDGSWRWLLWSARCDGEAWFAAAKDVTDRISLERQALHDPLTKLPNRLLFMDRLRTALTRLHRGNDLIAVLFIDLDRFKAINDNLGHSVGDDLLIAFSNRLTDIVRDSDTVSRLGGDEFVILAEGLKYDTEALSLADRVLGCLEEPINIGSAIVSIEASVGVSVRHRSGDTPEDLLREADVAMYKAKSSPGRRIGLFDESLKREMALRLDLEDRLRHAVSKHELRLLYQPAVELATGSQVGCEALLRWHPHDAPPLSPAEFLHLAEESELIVPIRDWVLQSACMQAAAWQRRGFNRPLVSVNLSASALTKVDTAERIAEALRYSGLPSDRLCIEVSEASLLHDLDRSRAVLDECKSFGVKIALDNFGSGHSSLTLLDSLPLDAIKIDRCIVNGFEHDRRKRAIATAGIAIAKQSGITSVAVGIETKQQLQLACELGCTIGQGYLLSAPLPPERLNLQGPLHVPSRMRWRAMSRLKR